MYPPDGSQPYGAGGQGYPGGYAPAPRVGAPQNAYGYPPQAGMQAQQQQQYPSSSSTAVPQGQAGAYNQPPSTAAVEEEEGEPHPPPRELWAALCIS